MAELKPCPFCGGKARTVLYHNKEITWIRNYVKCERCLATTATYVLEESAIEAWNRRYTPSEIDFDYDAED